MPDYIEDHFGHRRLARKGDVLRDGEKFVFTMSMMDAAQRALANAHGTFRDDAVKVTDSFGFAAGHRPGHLYHTDAKVQRLQDQAAAAYRERSERLHYANRRQRQDDAGDRQRQEDAAGDRGGTRALDAAQARELADREYQNRCQRMSNAWRNRQP
jgi:hypothetical protein